MDLAPELDIPNSPVNSVIEETEVEYIVFPRSGNGAPSSKGSNPVKALDDLQKMQSGAMKRHAEQRLTKGWYG